MNPTARTNPSLEHHHHPTDVLFLGTGGTGSAGTQDHLPGPASSGLALPRPGVSCWRRPEPRTQSQHWVSYSVLLSHSGPQSSHPWNADRNARQVSTHRALQALPREGMGQSRGYRMVLPPVTGICTQNTHQKRNSISRVIIFN